jgi:hypothetical protein
MRAVKRRANGARDSRASAPGDNQVLIQVAATSFNPSEIGLRSGLLRSVFPLDRGGAAPRQDDPHPRNGSGMTWSRPVDRAPPGSWL